MKRAALNLLLFFLILCSCQHKNEPVTATAKNTNEKVTDTFYNAESGITEYFISTSDSTGYNLGIKDSLRIKSTQSGPARNYCSEITWGKTKRFINFDKEKITYKTVETDWVNKDFICMNTYSDLSIGYKLFVPYNPKEKLIFMEKDVEKTDQVNNNMVYIDNDNSGNEITFVVMNLKTKKEKKIEIDIRENQNNYPYYDSLQLTKEKLVVFMGYPDRKLALDLTDLYTK